VKSIPSVLQTVRIPAELSVTALAGARPCLLAPVAFDDPSVPLLRLGPQAELGRILHRLVEDASRGEITSSTDADAAVRSHLDFLLREARQRLSNDAFSRPYAELKDSFSFLDWHSRTEIAIAEAGLDYRRSCKSAPRLKERRSGSADLDVLLSREGEFTLLEVPFRSRKLRLKGRIDEVVKGPSGAIQVTDYKTGRVLDDDGNMSANIVLQLRLYGLAILECLPQALVQPYVRSREEYYAIPFTPEDVWRTENERQELFSRLPSGQSQRAEPLAELGLHCRTCRIRHVCPRYRNNAAPLWAKPTAEFSLALDICGSILRWEKWHDGTYTLTLKDSTDRPVKIHRLSLSETDVEALTNFRQVWFFNLCSHEGGLKGGIWHHPRNFYQLPASRGESRAWSMEAFGVDDLNR
jgi:hypothetical protein